MEIAYVYQRKRHEFGRKIFHQGRDPPPHPASPNDIHFTDHGPESFHDVAPESTCALAVRPSGTKGVQAAPALSSHEVNTASAVTREQGMVHLEGGWPKDVNAEDVEHRLRYRRKVEKDEEYVKTVMGMAATVEAALLQNVALDIYEDYFSDPAITTRKAIRSASSGAPSGSTAQPMRIVNVFKDPSGLRTPVSSISWYPEQRRRFVASYANMVYQHPSASADSYIWDVEHPATPVMRLEPYASLMAIRYNPKDSHSLVGGDVNGLIQYWDVRKGSAPVESTCFSKSHRDPVFGLQWISSKSSTEFFTTSTDGFVYWWDLRKLAEPTESLPLDVAKDGRSIVGGTVLEYEPTMPTKFMVGTERGQVIIGNRKAKTPLDRVASVFSGAHASRVRALHRNPFFTKNFLSVGDWTAHVWSEDISSPIMSSKLHANYLTGGSWSPVRPALFFTTESSGNLCAWDLMVKSKEPLAQIQVSKTSIESIRVQEQGKFVCVGSASGETTLIELSEAFSTIQPNEKSHVSQLFEREAKREKLREAAAREKRLLKKRGGGGSGRAASGGAEEGEDKLVEKDPIEEAEANFFKVLNEKMGEV